MKAWNRCQGCLVEYGWIECQGCLVEHGYGTTSYHDMYIIKLLFNFTIRCSTNSKRLGDTALLGAKGWTIDVFKQSNGGYKR